MLSRSVLRRELAVFTTVDIPHSCGKKPFSRLKTDSKSTIITRRIEKINVFHLWGTGDCQFVCLQHSPSARVANFTLVGNCSFSPLVKQIAISQLISEKFDIRRL